MADPRDATDVRPPLPPTDEAPVDPAATPAHATTRTTDPEAPEADALEQSLTVPADEEDHDA